MLTRVASWRHCRDKVAANDVQQWPTMEHLDALDRSDLIDMYRAERRDMLIGLLGCRWALGEGSPANIKLFLTCSMASIHLRMVEWRKLLRGERAETPPPPDELMEMYIEQKL